MKKIKVMILSGEGINCESETAQAFEKLGASTSIIHLEEWKARPKLIHDYQILALPGGFSFGDEIHSGQILALDLKYSVGDELKDFIVKKGLIIGICNGFQILMKLGVFEESNERTMTLFHNESFKFQDRWVKCHAPESKCIWTKNLGEISLPIRHGEGRIIFRGDAREQKFIFENLISQKRVALIYNENINGSFGNIAGLTDVTGQILGLMPHPEAALESYLYPESFTQQIDIPLSIFKNGLEFIQENL